MNVIIKSILSLLFLVCIINNISATDDGKKNENEGEDIDFFEPIKTGTEKLEDKDIYKEDNKGNEEILKEIEKKSKVDVNVEDINNLFKDIENRVYEGNGENGKNGRKKKINPEQLDKNPNIVDEELKEKSGNCCF